MQKKTYIAIDLKSFYASVECVERGKDPMTTCLVVADPSRTEKTIYSNILPTWHWIILLRRLRWPTIWKSPRRFIRCI